MIIVSSKMWRVIMNTNTFVCIDVLYLVTIGSATLRVLKLRAFQLPISTQPVPGPSQILFYFGLGCVAAVVEGEN